MHAHNWMVTQFGVDTILSVCFQVFGFLSWIFFTVELIHTLIQCRCGKTQVSQTDVQGFEPPDQVHSDSLHVNNQSFCRNL